MESGPGLTIWLPGICAIFGRPVWPPFQNGGPPSFIVYSVGMRKEAGQNSCILIVCWPTFHDRGAWKNPKCLEATIFLLLFSSPPKKFFFLFLSPLEPRAGGLRETQRLYGSQSQHWFFFLYRKKRCWVLNVLGVQQETEGAFNIYVYTFMEAFYIHCSRTRGSSSFFILSQVAANRSWICFQTCSTLLTLSLFILWIVLIKTHVDKMNFSTTRVGG